MITFRWITRRLPTHVAVTLWVCVSTWSVHLNSCATTGTPSDAVLRCSRRCCAPLHQLTACWCRSTEGIRQQAAATLGTLGALGDTSHMFLHSTFASLSNVKEDEQTKLLCIISLQEYLNNANSHALAVTVPSIIGWIQQYLDAVPSSHFNLLPPSVGLLANISSQFPTLFQTHFQGVVDLLVGWTLDVQLPHSIKKRITEQFPRFEALWIQFLPFTTDLIGRLVTDMEGLATNIPDENIGRLLSLASCFVRISEGIGTTYALRSGDVVPRFLSLMTTVHGELRGRSKFWTVENDTIAQITQIIISNNIHEFKASALDASIEHLTPSPLLAADILAQLQILRQLWKALNHETAEKLFFVGSPFLQLRTHPDLRVKRCILLLVKST